MLKIRQATTARGKRHLKSLEPKIKEQKQTILLKGSKSSLVLNSLLSDLASLKKPNAISLNKKNEIRPFEDSSALEFICEKNNCSIFVLGRSSKKRPDCLCIGRTFDGKLLDMIEVTVNNFKSIKEISKENKSKDGSAKGGAGVGRKPLIVFSGELFSSSSLHQHVQNLFLDMFRNEEDSDEFALNGIEYVISITANNTPEGTSNNTANSFSFRVFSVKLKKSGEKTPNVELVEMGPFFDFTVGRVKTHEVDTWKEATKVSEELKPKKVKNVKSNELGQKLGRIHVGVQDLSKLQTRKMKGLKRKRDE